MKAIAMATVLTGCWQTDIKSTAVMMGDSLMENNLPYYTEMALEDNYNVMVIPNGIGGSTFSLPEQTDYWVKRIGAINAITPPDLIFISLGTNDAKIDPNYDVDMYAAAYAILEATAPNTRVYWILPTSLSGPREQEVRDALYAIEANWDMSIVEFDTTGYLLPDGIHLRDKGNIAFAKMMLDIAQESEE